MTDGPTRLSVTREGMQVLVSLIRHKVLELAALAFQPLPLGHKSYAQLKTLHIQSKMDLFVTEVKAALCDGVFIESF